MNRIALALILSAALMIFIGCGSTTTTTSATKTIATSSGPVTVPATTPVSQPVEPKLTPEQEKNNEAVLVAVKAAESVPMATNGMPKWVADHHRAFAEEGYTKDKAAFQRAFGWGTGTYKGKPFYWYAYTNTDAWLQFDLSVTIADEDLDRIRARKDGYGHAGEAELVANAKDKEWFVPGTVTWFGTNNDWTETRCVKPSFDPCDIGSALDDEVARLNKDLGRGLVFAVKDKFIW